MIRRSVVLVLGAGASQPYGYPLGSELRQMLCSPGEEFITLVAAAGHDRNAVIELAGEFKASNLASIDVFLERRPNLAALGRAMIAGVILQRDSYTLSGNWYDFLWQQLSRDAPTIDAFKQNNLKVITFNYDTSFERFMVNSVRASYDVTLDAAKIAFEATLPVIHVHGQIPYKLAGRVLAQSEATSESIRAFSDQIIALHEGQDNSQEFSMARHLLGEAERAIFLGFGFHPENMRRLRVQDWPKRQVVASVYGLVGQETERVVKMFAPMGAVSLEDRNCLDLLRYNVALFD
jgi:hypothetical protein